MSDVTYTVTHRHRPSSTRFLLSWTQISLNHRIGLSASTQLINQTVQSAKTIAAQCAHQNFPFILPIYGVCCTSKDQPSYPKTFPLNPNSLSHTHLFLLYPFVEPAEIGDYIREHYVRANQLIVQLLFTHLLSGY